MLSKMRGKMGGMVFRVDPDAGQVVSEYNPHPSNPRTSAQTFQRNKMNLAGQMSKLTPYAAIAGLSQRRRLARSLFVSNIVKNATTTDTSSVGRTTMTLNKEKLVLSKGAMFSVSASGVINAAQGKVTVTVVNNDADRGVIGARVVVYGFRDTELYGCYIGNAEFEGATQSVAIDLIVGTEILSDVADFNIYVIPIVESAEGVRTLYVQGVINVAEQANYGAAVDRELSALGAFGASYFVDTVSTE